MPACQKEKAQGGPKMFVAKRIDEKDQLARLGAGAWIMLA